MSTLLIVLGLCILPLMKQYQSLSTKQDTRLFLINIVFIAAALLLFSFATLSP